MCVYVCACVCAHVYVRICVCTSMCVHVCVHVAYVCVRVVACGCSASQYQALFHPALFPPDFILGLVHKVPRINSSVSKLILEKTDALFECKGHSSLSNAALFSNQRKNLE